MKKKIIGLIIILTLILLLAYFVLKKPKENDKICKIEFDKILNEVNDFYLGTFNNEDLSIEKPNILLDIVDVENILYAVNQVDINEYFIVIKNISDSEINLLEEKIKDQQDLSNPYFINTKLISEDGYAYFIVSLEKTSIIESLIKLGISCK